MEHTQCYQWGDWKSVPDTTSKKKMVLVWIAVGLLLHGLSFIFKGWQLIFWLLEFYLSVVLLFYVLATHFELHRFEASIGGISYMYKYVPTPLSQYKFHNVSLPWDAVASIKGVNSVDPEDPNQHRIFIALKRPFETGERDGRTSLVLNFATAEEMESAMKQISSIRTATDA